MTRRPAAWQPTASLDVLTLRASALAAVRSFFAARKVLEVETPLISDAPVSEPQLASVRCELAVRPGTAHYLHTSPEYHMKRLLAAGAPDIYQLCKVFRDGEAGTRHLTEFTLLEWYRHGFGFDGIIEETAVLITAIGGVLGRPVPPPLRYSYREIFLDTAGFDPFDTALDRIIERLTAEEPAALASPLATSLGARRQAWLDLAMATLVEPALQHRGLVIIDRYPAEQSALARMDPQDPRCALRFEMYLHGLELANGYHELGDAQEQRRRLESDRQLRRELVLPDVVPDEALLAALASGLPDCCGVALGVDRLLMALLGRSDIAEVVSFPVPPRH